MSAFPWIDDGRNKVWTERETGDWEACVVTAYGMGLIHGGVKMAAPYTQAERERLEKVKDEPQDLNTTDAMSAAVHRVQLRKLSTGTISDAVTRINVGLVLTGNGSPGTQWTPGFTGLHAVFYVPTSVNSGYLGDPLAPDRRVFELVTASTMAAWAAGRAGPNQAREVKVDEFAPVVPPPAPTPLPVTRAEFDALLAAFQNHGHGPPTK